MDRRDFLKTAVLMGGCAFFGAPAFLRRDAAAAEKEAPGEGRNVHGVFFSATGTTKRVVGELAGKIGGKAKAIDLARHPLASRLDIPAADVLIAGVPVYSGRVPAAAMRSVRNLRGKDTPAVAVAVYGNRDYDDALLELADALEENGFAVVAGAAFVGQHALFPKVAEGRPDAADLAAIGTFARLCGAALAAGTAKRELGIKGNRPYREAQPVPLKPTIDSSCTHCGVCVAACPVKALTLDRGRRAIGRDDAACISCAACVRACPTGAQAFRGPQYEGAAKAFAERMSERKEPEFFVD